MTLADLRIDGLILVCAVSAGIHGALVPEHLEEGTPAGVGFVVTTVLLAALAVALTRAPTQPVLLATATVLAGLIASYVLAVTTGFPVLHPEVEAVDGLALFTKAIEGAGVALALIPLAQPKGNYA